MEATATQYQEQVTRPNYGQQRTIPLHDREPDAHVQLIEDPDYVARLEVSCAGTTWRYGVDSDRRVTFLDAREDGKRVAGEEPDWMWGVFNQIGVRDR